jgi:prophage DNA circulation protein
MAVADVYAAFSFTPNGQQTLLLNGALEACDDELGSRLASFEYLKRDGAEVEPMGAAQARFTFRVVLLGSAPLTPGGAPLSAGARYAQLVQAQRAQPRGLLVHPRLGRWQVGWSRIRGHEQPARAVDAVECTLDFVEDQLDQAVSAEQQPTPQARAGEVVSAYSVLRAAVALRFGGSTSRVLQSAVTATETLASAAAAFATAGVAAAQNLTLSVPLPQQLGTVAAARDALLAALTATLAQTLEPDVSLTPFRHQAWMTYVACQFLAEAIAEQQPVLTTYTVAVAMSLDQVLLALYGKDAQKHLDEVMSRNRILTPLWIPAGTELVVVAPQVMQ